ncbi:GntR family transcriptional regulator [Litoreibacter arenae]|uniref:Transcriptional regulator, GntR family n=1 Tax=Litoreibacter arenae DSM 19593 TaxID=1123360 RepID=S9QDA7_9RHOB|nr:GntR family transcriptional regulator [Litoreibacter arenae]EPX79416.1 Transcriptional regulator, GntR family [Litoreibacter arenae DSM 19593]
MTVSNTQTAAEPVRKVRLSRKPLHERVADDLRDRIITGQLEPAEKINVGALAEDIGVSLTPLREALKLLAAEGLVDLTPNRGASVSEVTVDQTRNLFEVIAGIEGLAAELATRRMSNQDLAELTDLHAEMQRHASDTSREKYFAINRKIHDKIVAFAQNPILTMQRNLLAQQAERVRFIALKRDARRDEAMQEHEDLMAAFAARDPDLARRTWRKHLIASGEQTIALLAQTQTG